MPIKLPKPPMTLEPDARKYFNDLIDTLELVLTELDASAQKKGDPVILPRVTVDQLTVMSPKSFRAGQEGRLVLCVTAQSDGGALGVSHDADDGSGPQWKALNLGPIVS